MAVVFVAGLHSHTNYPLLETIEKLISSSSNFRSSHPEGFCKKVFLDISQHSQENMCQNLFFKKVTKLSNIILYVTIPIEIKRNVIGFFE